jgi:hypothetical protein
VRRIDPVRQCLFERIHAAGAGICSGGCGRHAAPLSSASQPLAVGTGDSGEVEPLGETDASGCCWGLAGE